MLLTKSESLYRQLASILKNEEGRMRFRLILKPVCRAHERKRSAKGAAHITDADVEEMIATLGRPEDFAAQDSSEDKAAIHPTLRLLKTPFVQRDENNKILGGVCSGIATG